MEQHEADVDRIAREAVRPLDDDFPAPSAKDWMAAERDPSLGWLWAVPDRPLNSPMSDQTGRRFEFTAAAGAAGLLSDFVDFSASITTSRRGAGP